MSIVSQPYNIAVIPSTAGTYYMPKGTTTALAIVVPAAVTITGDGTWHESTLTLEKTGAFTSYTFVAGDTIAVTAGTGATVATYTVASKTDANNIVLTASIGAAADTQTNISANMSVLTQTSNRSVMTTTQSAKGILIYRIEANGVAAANTDSIAVATQAGTTVQGAIFLTRSTTLGGPVLDAKPDGVLVQSASCLCFTTAGTTAWTVQYRPFIP